jgi:hypothetical protein
MPLLRYCLALSSQRPLRSKNVAFRFAERSVARKTHQLPFLMDGFPQGFHGVGKLRMVKILKAGAGVRAIPV